MVFLQIIFYLFLVITVYLLYRYIKGYSSLSNFYKSLYSKSKTKNFKVYPLNFGFGQISDFFGISVDLYKQWSKDQYENNNSIFLTFWFSPLIHTSDPEIIKQITITKRLPKPSLFYDSFKPILGNGLVLSKGEIWKKERNLINPVFTPQNVSRLTSIMEDHTNKILKDWKKKGQLELTSEVSTLTLSIISEAAFGITSDQKETSKLWNDISHSITPLFVLGMMFPMSFVEKLPLKSIISTEKMKKLIKEIIKNRKEKLEKGNDENEGDLLSLLMNAEHNGDKISEELIIDESLTFLFAGHDTTSSLVSNTIFFLCSYPEIQEKLRKEIMLHLRNKDHVTFEDVENMKYLNYCVNESLRLIPPVPEVDKETDEDIFIGDYFIKKGTTIGMNIYGLHHHPKIWENPEEFIPERWEEENLKKIPNLRYSFIPFSVGPRDCVGKVFAKSEAPLILALILKHFKIEFDHGIKKEDIVLDFEAVVRPKELKVKLTSL